MFQKVSKNKLKILNRASSLALFFCLFSTSAFAVTELPISAASASSTCSPYTADKTIDKNLSTYWRGTNSQPNYWLTLDLGQSKSLKQISIWWHKTYGSSNYNIQGSSNGTSWTNLLTGLSSAGGTTNPYQKNHTISGSYRYVRIYLNSIQSTYPIIYEAKLYGPDADTTPPTGTIKINNDAQYTSSVSVTLNLSATDSGSGMGTGSQMKFSNDNTNWSTAEAYATTKTWALSFGDGTKTVYVKYKDVAGNWSSACSDTIILDTLAPTINSVSPADGSTFEENAAVAVSANVTDTDSSPLEYQFSVDSVIKKAWSSQTSYIWTATSGIHNIKVEVRDAGGTTSKQNEVCVFRAPLAAPN